MSRLFKTEDQRPKTKDQNFLKVCSLWSVVCSLLLVVILFLIRIPALGLSIDSSKINIKGGPTGQSEQLVFVWVEAQLSPNAIKDDRRLNLELKLTSKAEGVKVIFDFDNRGAVLSTKDNTSWEGAYEVSREVAPGIHIARFMIKGKGGKSIQRTLDFFVEEAVGAEEIVKEKPEDIFEDKGWPLKIISDTVIISGETIRKLKKDSEITGLYKYPWYRVKLADESEGWVISSAISEPTQDYYLQGYCFYTQEAYVPAMEKYKKVLEIDPQFVKAHYWLAKTYSKLGEEDSAIAELNKILELDKNNLDALIFSTELAQTYFRQGLESYKDGKYQEAIKIFKKVISLKPTSITAYLNLGECFEKVGLHAQAREMRLEALKLDPENKDYKAILAKKKPVESQPGKAPAIKLPSELIQEAINIVKNSDTSKGTMISSALESVTKITRSLGALVKDEAWQVSLKSGKYLVSYLCLQDKTGKGDNFEAEAFVWRVDIDTRALSPENDNAKLLMSRW